MADHVLFSHPVLIAAVAALVVGGGLVGLETATQPVLSIASVDGIHAPVLDGDISDQAWMQAVPTEVMTAHGGDFGGDGNTRIVVRGVHDDRNVYFAFVWDDPSRSLERPCLIKKDGRWSYVRTQAKHGGESNFYDDRLAIMLAHSSASLIGAAIHLGRNPLNNGTSSLSGRGLHYVAEGSFLDVWEWNSVSNSITTVMQDDHVGQPLPPTVAQASGEDRYTGGFAADQGMQILRSNATGRSDSQGDRNLLPAYLPRHEVRLPTVQMLKATPANSDATEFENVWGLRASQAELYSATADSLFPDGSLIPGVVVDDEGLRTGDEVRGAAVWAGGKWVLEVTRSLNGGAGDLAVSSGTLMWLAAFDHAQTRHTYHLRPLKLELK